MTNDLIAGITRRYREFVRDTYSFNEVIPWWKGYVTELFVSRRYKVAPLGFNILFHLAYSLYIFVSHYPVEFVRFRHQQEDNRQQAKRPYTDRGFGRHENNEGDTVII